MFSQGEKYSLFSKETDEKKSVRDKMFYFFAPGDIVDDDDAAAVAVADVVDVDVDVAPTSCEYGIL